MHVKGVGEEPVVAAPFAGLQKAGTPRNTGVGVRAGLAQMCALQECCCGCEDGAMAVYVQVSPATKHGTVCGSRCMHFTMAFCLLLLFSCI